jgi:ubiquinone/menaquinone biosynthesis C-methylase UbiE
MCAFYPESKVEINGFTARHYDILMDVITFGVYPLLMQKAIRLMGIKSNDKIIDLGAGTGRNACLMMKCLSAKGQLVGLDISSEMTAQFERRCAGLIITPIIK